MEHLTPKQIDDHSTRRLDATELLAVMDHLSVCESCREQVSLGHDSEFLAAHSEIFTDETSDEPLHLTLDQTADYVDKNLTGDQFLVVQDHLSRCTSCAFAVTDLRSFRNEIATSLDHELRPTGVTPVPVESWWRKSIFQRLPVPAFAAGFGILLMLVAVWFIWRSVREQQPRPEIVEIPTSSPLPTPPVESPSPTPQAASVVAQLKDGDGVLQLDQQGTLSGAENLPPAYQNLVKRALSGQRIERSSQLEGLTRGPSHLMGPDAPKTDFHVVGPIGTVSLSNRPTLSWTKLEGASAYVVEIYDEQFKPVASSDSLTSNTWTPPALGRGRVYAWQVKATKDGEEVSSPKPPAPQAKFRVLDQKRTDEITRARNSYGKSHLTLGLLYAEAGLLTDAERELRLVLRANPDSELAQNLLRQVRSLR